MRFRSILESVGAALLFTAPYFSPLILPDHLAVYHHQHPLRHLIDGLFIDMAACAAAGILFLFLSTYLRSGVRSFVGACLAGIILGRAAELAVSLIQGWYLTRKIDLTFRDPSRYKTGGWPVFYAEHHMLLFASIAIIPCVLIVIHPKWAAAIIRGTRLFAAGFGLCGLWIIPELAYLSLALAPDSGFDRPQSQIHRASGRIVWVLFDELSYDLIVQHPPAGMTFPNFDRLRAESVSFAAVEPFDLFTERIIPSIFVDRHLDRIESDLDGRLLNLDLQRRHWVEYDAGQSLFEQARRQGWDPAISGWYNPYCRIFSQILSACRSIAGIYASIPVEAIGASEDMSAVADAWVVPGYQLRRIRSNRAPIQDNLRARSVGDYRLVMQQSKEMIDDGRLRFVFLHLPVPHPPGIYDRGTRLLCACGNYLDNLALADVALGELRNEINSGRSASQTTLIVSSDHSWRVPLWRDGPEWTPEEERVSKGQFDARPVFMVHFPDQSVGSTINAELPELMEHDIVSSMLDGKIENVERLQSFISLLRR